jgi:hypothetical protein
LRIITGEKNVLLRDTTINLERFHKYYEDMLEEHRTSMLKMYKDSMNYKRSYDRLIKDFDELKVKTASLR